MVILWLVALFLFLVLLITYYRYAPTSSGSIKLPPGSFGLPFVGENLEFLGTQRANKARKFFDDRAAKYGAVFKTSLVGSPTVIVPAPEGNRFLFANENKLVVNSWPASMAKLLGPGSLTMKIGDEHKRLRQVLMAFLKPEALQRYVSKVSMLAQEHLSRYWQGKEEVVVYPLMKTFTFSLACNLFIGLQNDEDQREELSHLFHDYVIGMLQLPINIPGTRYYKGLQGRRGILELLDKHIAERKKHLSAGVLSKDHDLLSVLLTTCDDKGRLISEADIKDNILVLLFAGHDTSSSALTMIFKYLAENPIWMDKVYQEQLKIMMDKHEGEPLDWEDTKKMKWTWRVIQETLRLQPPVQGTFREAITDFEFGGFSIPKGWKLYWTVNNSHRRAEFFTDPDQFDPSRFENDGPAPNTFVPFGGGPRMCPGYEFAKMEMLVFIHHIITKYEWSLVNNNEEITVDPMPYPKKGLPVKIQMR